MMAFFDNLKKNFGAVSSVSESVVRISGGAIELRKLKMELESLKKELYNCYAQIGRLVVEKTEGTDIAAEMEMLVKQIADCKEAIAEMEQLIAEKSGKRICPVCGAQADKDAVFCKKCGTHLPEYSNEEEEYEEADESVEETEAPEDEEV